MLRYQSMNNVLCECTILYEFMQRFVSFGFILEALCHDKLNYFSHSYLSYRLCKANIGFENVESMPGNVDRNAIKIEPKLTGYS